MQSTTWLKRESEAEAVKRASQKNSATATSLSKWFGGSNLKAKWDEAKLKADADFEQYRKQVWNVLTPKLRFFKSGLA